jgi:zona occludens toxin
MIHGISGKPGGGKSYEAVVSHILPIVTKDKRKVVTNLPLNIDRFCAVYGEFCRDLIEVIDGQFHNYGGQRPFSKKDHYLQYEGWQNDKGQKVYFFIDECHLAMPTQGTEKELTEFFSMHRHYGFDIMLITQNFRKVNRDIKDMIVNHYRAIKKSMMGQDHKYILKVHDGASSSNASVVATHDREYQKKYFAFYTSHTKSDSSVDEATSNDIEKWYKHWSIKMSVVFLLFAFFLLSSLLSSKYSTPKLTPEVIVKSKAVSVSKMSGELEKKGSAVQSVLPEGKPVPVRFVPPEKTQQQIEYEAIVANSKKYHPFHKISLSISGHAEYMDVNRQVTTHYFSATQNGQHVFTIKTRDLLLAGYDVKVFSECSIRIQFYDFVDYLTCNAPKQGTNLGGETLAANQP